MYILILQEMALCFENAYLNICRKKQKLRLFDFEIHYKKNITYNFLIVNWYLTCTFWIF